MLLCHYTVTYSTSTDRLMLSPSQELEHINGTNVLPKFHEETNGTNPCGHVFQQTLTIFKLVQDIIGTNLLTKFHEDPTIIVAATVLTRQIFMTHNGRQTIDKRKRKAQTQLPENQETRVPPPPGGHVFFLPIQTIFKLNCRIQETNVLTKFHENLAKNRENCPTPGGHAKNVTSRVKMTSPGGHKTHVLIKFHEDWTKNLHEDWASNVTSTTNVLTKFHEDRTINMASRVFTSQNVDAARRTTDKRRSQKLTMT
ncbi:hypothetical protein DPMN_083056 [Dreissena polymorpha]|uniref:Uncharacterized protein n=1 Tax=Dreissena polymorpha TaxID=45954 RepID=A0A9D3YC33_DREPO|nr:hypothetical protein DPMN_083056 [Dreissena polymorpha]